MAQIFRAFSIGCHFSVEILKHYVFRGPIHDSVSHGIDNKLNETYYTNYHLPISKNRPFGSKPLEPAVTRPTIVDPIFLSLELLFQGTIS